MNAGLSLETFPRYLFSAFKTFLPGEKHVNRICREDVLILMLEGTLHFWEDGIPLSLSAGEYYIQRKGLRQEGHIPSDDAHYYYVHFSGDFSADGSRLAIRGRLDKAEILPLCRQLEQLRSPGNSLVAQSAVFYQLLSALNRSSATPGGSPLVARIRDTLCRDLRKHYTLDELARLCGYSKNHIINIFRKQTGQTPYAYIQSIRLEEAKQLLKYSTQSITAIALDCGFGSYVNFYKEFLKTEGCSPAQWRSR